MLINGNSPLRLGSGLGIAVLFLSLMVGCGRQNNNPHHLATGGRQAFRTACADDIQKLCANDSKKRRCLRTNYSQLSESCKTALTESRGNGGNERLAVCSADIQKLCANEPHKRRCLRENLDKLSDACRSAVNQRHDATPDNTGDGDND